MASLTTSRIARGALGNSTHQRSLCVPTLPTMTARIQTPRISTASPLTPGRAAGVACQAQAANQPSGSEPKRHAFLHDFCMCIPYGAISALAGVAFYFMNAANLAAAAFIGGATALAASVFSLQEWKAGGDSKVYTLTSLASSAAVAYTSVCSLPLLSGVGYAAAVVLCGLSAALSLFCAYNVLAGGNPPPKAGGKGGAKAA